jgi:hypothetical protein
MKEKVIRHNIDDFSMEDKIEYLEKLQHKLPKIIKNLKAQFKERVKTERKFLRHVNLEIDVGGKLVPKVDDYERMEKLEKQVDVMDGVNGKMHDYAELLYKCHQILSNISLEWNLEACDKWEVLLALEEGYEDKLDIDDDDDDF